MVYSDYETLLETIKEIVDAEKKEREKQEKEHNTKYKMPSMSQLTSMANLPRVNMPKF